MPSTRAQSRDAQGSLKNLDDFDLTAFDRPTICAILLPESSSAKRSARLEENDAKTAHIAAYKPLPSPGNSCSEDESITRTQADPQTSRYKSRSKEERDGKQLVIVLKQSRDEEKFNFVSSSSNKGLRTGNDVVLKHRDSECEDVCYINLLHLELYPDPDGDALVLYNRSTSEFTAHSILKSQANKIKPGYQANLDRGTWRLTLGKGLTFQIKVLRRAPGELYHGCLRLSPRAAAVSTKATSVSERQPGTTSTRTEVFQEKRYKARYPGERVTIVSALEARQWSDSLNEHSSHPPVTIGTTAFTKVFKVNRNQSAVAIKVCRKPDSKQSAEMWRNEVNILKQLRHSSVVGLLEHNALKLSLELEYIGPDLAQFVDTISYIL